MYTQISKQTAGLGEEQRLREQIELLESRLRVMGLDGDCAYERAMSSLYQRLLEELRTRLAMCSRQVPFEYSGVLAR